MTIAVFNSFKVAFKLERLSSLTPKDRIESSVWDSISLCVPHSHRQIQHECKFLESSDQVFFFHTSPDSPEGNIRCWLFSWMLILTHKCDEIMTKEMGRDICLRVPLHGWPFKAILTTHRLLSRSTNIYWILTMYQALVPGTGITVSRRRAFY